MQNHSFRWRIPKDSQVTVGPLLKEMIHYFHVKYAFVGTDGYDEELGFYRERFDA